MTTMMQAVTRAREAGFPPDGLVSVRSLQQRFQPIAEPGSVRSLLVAMNDRAATVRPFAVILCRFKEEPPDPDEARWLKFFIEAFTPGSGGLVDYWKDTSLGAIDVAGTRVFGWVEVDMRRNDAGFPPIRRGDLTAAGIRAVQANGGDPLTGYFNQLSIYLQSTTSTGVHIDGSTDGNTGRINLTPPFDGDVIAHEMGHSLGMDHDADVTGDTQYHDPCCIMSQNGTFPITKWGLNFGPAICLPHLILQGWNYRRRMLFDEGAWLLKRDGIQFQLAPNSNPAAHAFLGASLVNPRLDEERAYLLEFINASYWNQGVGGMPYVMIRRITNKTDLGQRRDAMYMHAIYVDMSGGSVVYLEPYGNTEFTVTPTSLPGPIVNVVARKLAD